MCIRDSYYYGEGDSPYYPADIDDYALKYFGPVSYTHLDVYKRQSLTWTSCAGKNIWRAQK